MIMGWVTGIKFDGLNHKEVEKFIQDTKHEIDTDLHLELGEGEVFFSGSYYKAPCHIFKRNDTEDLYVLPESIVDFIQSNDFYKQETKFYKRKTFLEALHQGQSNLHVAQHKVNHKDYKPSVNWNKFQIKK